MAHVFASAALYFIVVFAGAFALGALRVLIIAPRIGAVAAVSLELPLVLGLSWFVCSQVLRHFEVPGQWLPRLWIGALAFALLMIAELALSLFGFRRSAKEHFAAFLTPAGLIGLVGQIGFALIPMAQA